MAAYARELTRESLWDALRYEKKMEGVGVSGVIAFFDARGWQELPENTLPMMTGQGPYGAVEMGGMFSVLKVRRNQKPGDYRDPGWYKQPKGTQAYEWTRQVAQAPRATAPGGGSMPANGKGVQQELTVRKPGKHAGH